MIEGPEGPVVVRRATAADAAAMVGVQARSWQVAYAGMVADEIIARVVATETTRGERLRDRLADAGGRQPGWIATIGPTVVGMAIAGPSRDDGTSAEVAELYAIYLEPDVIGTGVGRTLLRRVVDDLRGIGFAEATLWVLTANARARRFYERTGWRLDGATKQEEFPGGVLALVRYRLPLDRGVPQP